jgi:peptide deformylase
VGPMPIKPLIILPDPVLRQVSKPVERVDAPLRKLADDMLETMYDAPGIGLAAIQIGEPLRMLVIDLAKEDETPAPQVFINPEILESADARSSTKRAACRSRTITPRSNARRRCG